MKSIKNISCLFLFLLSSSIMADTGNIPGNSSDDDGRDFTSVFKSYYSDLPSESISIQDLKLKHTFNIKTIPAANGSTFSVGYEVKGFSGGAVNIFRSFNGHRVSMSITGSDAVFGDISRRSFGCLGNLSSLELNQLGLGLPQKSKPLGYTNQDMPTGTLALFKDHSLLKCESSQPVIHFPDGTKVKFGSKHTTRVNNYNNYEWKPISIEDKHGLSVDLTKSNITFNGVEISQENSPQKKLLKIKDDNKNYITTFNYNNRGEIDTVKDSENRITTYTHTGAFTGAANSIESITFPSGLKVEYTYQGYWEGSRNSLTVSSKKITGPSIQERRFQYTLINPELDYPGYAGHRSIAYEYDVETTGSVLTLVNYIHAPTDYDGRIYKQEIYKGPHLSVGWVLRNRWEEGTLLAKNETQWEKYSLGNVGCYKQLIGKYFTIAPAIACSGSRKSKEYTSYITDDGYDTFYTDYITYGKYNGLTKYKQIFSSSSSLPSRSIDQQTFYGLTKYSKFTYSHNRSKWLTNHQIKEEYSSSDSGYTNASQLILNSETLDVEHRYGFGQLKESYTYHVTGTAKGALKSKTLNQPRLSGNGKITTLYSENYIGGIAETTTFYSPNGENTIQEQNTADSFGNVLEHTDRKGTKTRFKYDTIGRLIAKDIQNDANYGRVWLDTLYQWDDINNKKTTTRCILNDEMTECASDVEFEIEETYDANGQIILTKFSDLKYPSARNSTRYKILSYDKFGRLAFESVISDNRMETIGTSFYYDFLNRTVRTEQSGLGTIDYSYLSGHKLMQTDGRGNSTTKTFKSFSSQNYKNEIEIASPESILTIIDIDVGGFIRSITQSNEAPTDSGGGSGGGGVIIEPPVCDPNRPWLCQQPRSVNLSNVYSTNSADITLKQTEERLYDSNKQLCLIKRADVGNTVMKYNALGKLAWKKEGTSFNACLNTAPEGSTHFTYNNLGLLHKTDYSSTALDLNYEYDFNGNLTGLNNSNVNQVYTFNNRNLLETEQITIDDQIPISIQYGYSGDGHASEITYPDGTRIKYSPNAFGEARSVAEYDKSNNLKQNFITNVNYHPNGMAKSYVFGNGVKHELELYSDSHLPKRLKDTKTGYEVMDLTYSYDKNGNIKSILDGIDTGYSISDMQYDGVDRLTTVTGATKVGNSNITYDVFGNIKSYSSKNRSLVYTYNADNNRLQSVSGVAGKYGAISYDDRGNIDNNGKYSLTFNAANQLSSANGNTYLYDGFNRRVKKVEGNNTSYSIFNRNGQLLFDQTGVLTGNGINYIYLGDKLIAKYGNVPTTNLAESRQHYRPYGESIEGSKDTIGYTGHEYDVDLGLNYMQARYYDPVIGRFYSNDPLGYRDIHSFNRYAYANSNPYKYIDPNGLNSSDILSGFEHWAEMWIGAGESVSSSIPRVTINPTRNNVRSIASTTSLGLAGLSLTPCSGFCGGASLLIDSSLAIDNAVNGEYDEAFLTAIPGVGGEVISRSYKGLKVVDPKKADQIGTSAGILTGQTINKSQEKSTSKSEEPKFFVIEMPSRAEKYRAWKNRGTER